MPTASGRESTLEREARQRAENYAAIRSLYTPEILAQAREDAQPFIDGTRERKETESMYPAGEQYKVTAGVRRTIKVDEGEVKRLALVDAFKNEGYGVIAHTLRFDLFGGRHTMVYGLALARD